MKLKEQTKYEKHDYVLLMVLNQFRIIFTLSSCDSG